MYRSRRDRPDRIEAANVARDHYGGRVILKLYREEAVANQARTKIHLDSGWISEKMITRLLEQGY